MFETIENNEEIIKASVKLIWMATNGKVVNIIFDDPILSAKVVLNNDTSKIIILDEPEAVLLNKNNYIKIRNELVRKSSITIDEVEIDNEEDRESRLDASNVTSQEPNIESSFEISERDSTIDNERAKFSQGDDNLNELDNTLSKSNVQESLQNNCSPLDEYSNMNEEIDELIFDALATSCKKRKEVVSYKSNSTRIKSQSKINDSFKVTKEFRKSSNKNTDDTLDRVSSDLTNDSLPSINEVLGQLFVAKIVKNINEKANISQNSNDLKLGEKTSESQLNNEQKALSSKDASNVANEKEIVNVPRVQKSTTQEIDSSENVTTNLAEDDSEEISEIISNVQLFRLISYLAKKMTSNYTISNNSNNYTTSNTNLKVENADLKSRNTALEENNAELKSRNSAFEQSNVDLKLGC
ncbi:31569_t:CDS:10 [Gigaspora margarita]|uniref:31569_t:CDS:1 n=1 Tax=Gigaspora margarita TaxID=4874 RepID=A0ABN7VBB5_GIGMA|nr:31569_t:CDS:10 [Gigaspora margarita]